MTINKEANKKMMEEVYERRKAAKSAAPALSVEVYQDMKAQKMSDAKIMQKFGMNNTNFYEWKRSVGLVNSQTVARKTEATPVKPQQAAQEPINRQKENHVEMIERVKYDVLWTKYKTLELKYNAAVQDLESTKAEIIDEAKNSAALESELSTLEEKYQKLLNERNDLFDEAVEKATASSAELINLATENERLENYEKDYRNLEIDYRNLHTENDRLKRMLDRLKNTERMNLWMMEHYVDMQRQVDEVMG